MAMFAKNEEAQKLCTQHMDKLETDYCGEGNWLMVWNEIKWYESYPDVGPVVAFIEALTMEDLSEYGMKELEGSEDRKEYSDFFRFCRVGEDCDDIQVEGYGFDDIAPQTSISY